MPKSSHPRETHVPGHRPEKARQRVIDTAGMALFHAAIAGLFAWSAGGLASPAALFVPLLIGVDIAYFFRPPKQRAILDPDPGAEMPSLIAQMKPFTPELLVLLVPPGILISWFLFLIWMHRTLTQYQLAALVVAVPVVVWLVSWTIKRRLTRYNVGVKNEVTKFIAYSMLAIWGGAIFLFGLLLVSFLTSLDIL